jgi:pimeloyl-ACP methyl ester carboxylesterase
MADRVADLVGLLDALDVEEPLLMGHSMGGATVATAAAEHADRVRGAILEDPAGFGWEPPMGPDERAERARSDVADWTERGVDAMERERAHDLGAERVRAVPDQPRREAVGMVECRPAVAEIARDGYPEPGYPDLLPDIDVPTLVLRSDADPEQRRRDLDAAAALPDGRLVHVPGAGHYVVGSRREAAMQELRTFLRRF